MQTKQPKGLCQNERTNGAFFYTLRYNQVLSALKHMKKAVTLCSIKCFLNGPSAGEDADFLSAHPALA